MLLFTAFLGLFSKSCETPLACNIAALSPAERQRHFVELGPALAAARTGVSELPDGYEFRFPSDHKTVAMLLEWIEQERRCCPFFDIAVHFAPNGGDVSVRITGPAGTKGVIDGAIARR